MAGQDFATAAFHLETAYTQDEDHRGTRKSLGYSYTWLGNFDQALGLLVEIPEARNEMDVYTWWWETQGRQDLASNANAMSELLSSATK